MTEATGQAGVCGLTGLSWVVLMLHMVSSRARMSKMHILLDGMPGTEQLGFELVFLFLSWEFLQQDHLTSLYGSSGLREQMSQDKPLYARIY